MPGELPHPELRRLAEALRQQPALASRYAAAADLDSLERRLREDGYAVPRAALERAVVESGTARSELDDSQLDQVQGGNLPNLWPFLAPQPPAEKPLPDPLTLPSWATQGRPG